MPRIERISSNDLTTLATDRGQVPMHIAAVLELHDVGDPQAVVAEIGRRITSVRRFRQRLVRVPFGGGRPYWQDVPGFAPSARRVEGELLEVAADVVCERLPMDLPLWRLVWCPVSPGRIGVILVVHHVLADGMGGLAVLAALADGMPLPPPGPAVAPPTFGELLRDAVERKVDGLRRLPATGRDGLSGLRELRSGSGPGRLAPTSLTRPTGTRRQVRVVECALEAVRRQPGSVNDVVLGAVSSALIDLLAERGERPARLVVSVPISGRRAATTGDLGNDVGVVPVAIPTDAGPEQRLRLIAAQTAKAKQGDRGSSAVILSWLFRGLATVGLGQYFVDHQRLVHTFETNLRGPQQRLSVAGCRVERIVPVAVNPGNVAVSFDVLSYAGNLGITIVSDPAQVPDPDHLAALVMRAGSENGH